MHTVFLIKQKVSNQVFSTRKHKFFEEGNDYPEQHLQKLRISMNICINIKRKVKIYAGKIVQYERQ